MAVVHPDLEDDVRQQVTAVVEQLRPADVGEEMAALLIEAMPELGRMIDEDLRASLVRSCESNVSAVWQHALTGGPSDSITPPAEAVAFAHDLVHRGVQLPALLRSYRLGHDLVERRFEETAAKLELDPERLWRALAYASRCFFAYVDAVCSALVEDYERERARWIRGAAAARAELVGAILARKPIDSIHATHKLRYDVGRRHMALIVWHDASELTDRVGSLEGEAATLAAALGGGPLLSVPIGERVLWAWTSGDQLDDDPQHLQHRMADGVRAAIGTCAVGLAGMAESHEQARAARRLAEVRGVRSGTVVGYRAGGLIALLTADPAEAVRFTELELGELGGGGDAEARLRATLRIYLEENLSPARAARRLGIHQNTVVYRVKRAEELLRRPVEQRRLGLEVALRLAEMLDGLKAAASSEQG